MLDRRDIIKAGSGMALLAWALPGLGKAADAPVLLKDAEAIYNESLVIDMLADEVRDSSGLEQIQQAGLTTLSTTLGVRRPEEPNGSYMMNAFTFDNGVKDCIDWNNFIEQNSTALAPARSAADIRRAKQEGKTAVMLNFQNSPIEGELDNIDLFHSLGIRAMQVTYNERNLLGDGATERTNAGLSDFGIAAVHRMNEVGILVDSSHSGSQTTMDTIVASKRIPIISHANCAALNEHPRNKSDDIIRALAKKGGVMGLTTVNTMVKRNFPVTIEHWLDHVDYLVKLVGVDHVGFGTDTLIRGWPTDPKLEEEFLKAYGEPYFKSSYRFRYPFGTEGMNDANKWRYATAGLIKRGYKDDDIIKIIGGNWLRVISEVVG
ncbi:dipeptidase [Qipengyuania qiaonensis]|uniref:Dipeptidase n=1 Tax=Qipengyuania qiaonensis TaxID=2867240 RepID=A0ABS7J9G0_9SPHN|nr:membrane dipeptidase [Qipengyuania qiaonensis]MBX7482941.1 dipeptidase [Qipengyuania qiaonensis]